MKKVTIAEAFEIAIAAEQSVEKMYGELESKFADHEEVAAFWKQYTRDEADHAKWLGRMKTEPSPEQLAKQVDASTAELLQSVVNFSVEKALGGVKNLQDAYELVSEIENGELNAIFQFLLDNFEADARLRDFLREQLNKHIARLVTDFPTQYREMPVRMATLAKRA